MINNLNGLAMFTYDLHSDLEPEPKEGEKSIVAIELTVFSLPRMRRCMLSLEC